MPVYSHLGADMKLLPETSSLIGCMRARYYSKLGSVFHKHGKDSKSSGADIGHYYLSSPA